MVILSALMLNEDNLLIETNYGPLFLDTEDFEKFKFDPYWVVENYDSDNVLQLMTEIKQYYIELAHSMIERGELNYEDFK